MRKLLVLAAVVLVTSGCAAGVKYQYHDINPETTLNTRGNIAVGVHDRRAYVVSGKKTETFSGLRRGGYGEPYDVNTESGAPLAKEFRSAIVSLLKRSGATTTEVELNPKTSGTDAQQALLKAGGDKSILLTLHEWESDTFFRIGLYYDLELVVLGPKGDVLGTKRLEGKDVLSKSGFEDRHGQITVPAAFRKKIEELFSDPSIVKALQ